MYCPKCGFSNRSGATFCTHCGAHLSSGPARQAALQPGQLMKGGAYRIVAPLSKGGMGALYLAVQHLAGVERKCVVKEMLDYFDANNPQEAAKAGQRFQEEAATLARLHHGGIPVIYDYFTESGRNYIVMEYVEGADLREGLTREDDQHNTISGQPYPIKDVVAWGVQVCKILEYMASLPQPVIHHDIKPANLVLDKQLGEVRLVDFGTAKARMVAQSGGQVGLAKSSLYGTEGYAPPEQYSGRSTGRSDVYALAATMYHLLTDDDPGDHPFLFPKLDQIDDALAQILRRALERDDTKRCEAGELGAALEGWQQSPSPGPPTKSRSYRVLMPAVAEALIGQTAQVLARVLNLPERQALALTYAAPCVIYKTQTEPEVGRVVLQLKAAGVMAQRIEIDESRSQGLPAPQKSELAARGQILGLTMARLASDKLCRCYVCGHEWTSRKATGDLPPAICPQCKSQDWSQHRLFKCSNCDHEFAHSDQRSLPQVLFPACPGCGTTAWQPASAPVLRLATQKLDLGVVRVGQAAKAVLQVSNAGKGSLRGVVRCRESWLHFDQAFTASGAVTIPVDTRTLSAGAAYRGTIDVISSGGTAEIPIQLVAQVPECIDVQPSVLQFGVVGTSTPPAQTLHVRNTGGGTLNGTVSVDVPWLQVSTAKLAGNSVTLAVALKPADMPGGQALIGAVRVATNGGEANIRVHASSLPTVMTLIPTRLHFADVPSREKRRQVVRLLNSGSGRLEGRITSAPSWLRVSPQTWSGNSTEFEVEVDGRGLSDGVEHSGNIRLTSNAGTVDLPVNAQALGPTLHIEPKQLDLGVRPAGSQVRRRAEVRNAGLGNLQGEVRSSASWLLAEPQRFSGNCTLQVSAATVGLAPARYQGSLFIISNGGQASIDVQLQVTQASKLAEGAKRYGPTALVILGAALLIMLVAGVARLVESGLEAATPVPVTLTLPQSSSSVTAQVPTAADPTSSPAAPVATSTPADRATESSGAGPSPTSPLRPTATPTPRCSAPGVCIRSPQDGATVARPVVFYGTADIPRFDYYKFELWSQAGRTWSFVDSLYRPVSDGQLLSWDANGLAPGTYRLRLVVVDLTGNFPTPCEIQVNIR